MPEAAQQQTSTFTNQPADNSKNEPEKELIKWVAPSRPFKRQDKKFYVTLISIAAVIGLVLFFVDGWLPVVLIISLVFLFYIMSTVPPEILQYRITDQGMWIADRRTDWAGARRFWFTRRFDSDLLVVETATLPGRIEVVINPQDKEEIEKHMRKLMPYEEASPSFLDRSANWFGKRMPS